MIEPTDIKNFVDHLVRLPDQNFKNLDQRERQFVKIILENQSLPSSLTIEDLAQITRKIDLKPQTQSHGILHAIASLWKGLLNLLGLRISIKNIILKLHQTDNYFAAHTMITHRYSSSLSHSQVILMGEIHNIPAHNELEAWILNHYGKDDDIILCEGMEGDVSSTHTRHEIYHHIFKDNVVHPRCRVYGWEKEEFHTKHEQTWDEFEHARSSSSLPAEKRARAYEAEETYMKKRNQTLTDAIKEALKKFPGKKIFVIAGREHLLSKAYDHDILTTLPKDIAASRVLFRRTGDR